MSSIQVVDFDVLHRLGIGCKTEKCTCGDPRVLRVGNVGRPKLVSSNLAHPVNIYIHYKCYNMYDMV